MRTYSEHEVSAIIERAVERQQAAETGGGGTGLTLDEIERIGREAGIDPSHLRAAAEEMNEAGRTLTRQTRQTRTQVVVERWIDAPFSSAGWEDAVAHLRTEFGAPIGAAFGSALGETVQQVGEAVEWSHTNSLGIRTRVTVSPRGDRTRLHMTQLVGMSSPTVEGIGYGLIIAVVVAVLMAGVAAAISGGSTPWILGTLGVSFLLAWLAAAPGVAALDRRWRAKKLAQLDALADDLGPILSAPARDAEATPGAAAAPDGRLDLDLDALAEDEPETEVSTHNGQRVR